MLRSLLLALMLATGVAQQVGPAMPSKKEKAGERIEAELAKPAPSGQGATGIETAISQGTGSINDYTSEVAAEVSKFPEYLAKVPPFKGTLRIDGSTSMASLLLALGRAYATVYPEVDVKVKQGGSSRGLASLKAGECDAAAVSRDLSEAEVRELETTTGKKVFQVPIALDAVCVFVNKANPLPSITREQLNGIFAITHSMTKNPVLRWDDLDPNSPLGANLMPLYVLPETHGTMQSFMAWAMPGEGLQTITRQDEWSPASVVNACCAYRSAIGIAGYMNRQRRANMVPVSPGMGQPAVAPNFRTIRDHTYPMSRPLNLVVLAADEASVNPMVLDFLKFVWSESGQDTVATLKAVVVNLDRPPALMRESVQRPYTAASTEPAAPAR